MGESSGDDSRRMIESSRAAKQWGQAWLAIGLLTAFWAISNQSRDGLLLLTLVYGLVAAIVTGCVCGNFRTGVVQFFSTLALIIGATVLFAQFNFPPVGAVAVWLGLAAASANFFAGRHLSLRALIGQILAPAAVSFSAVIDFEASVWVGVGTFLATLPCLIAGTLLARRNTL